MSKVKHAHRLRRMTYKNGTEMYICTLPDCSFKDQTEALLGKRAMCNLCGDEFIMNAYQIRLKSPHCTNCAKVKIKGHDGKKQYVRRRSLPFASQIIQVPGGIAVVKEAKDVTADLRSRLDGLLKHDEDEDI